MRRGSGTMLGAYLRISVGGMQQSCHIYTSYESPSSLTALQTLECSARRYKATTMKQEACAVLWTRRFYIKTPVLGRDCKDVWARLPHSLMRRSRKVVLTGYRCACLTHISRTSIFLYSQAFRSPYLLFT